MKLKAKTYRPLLKVLLGIFIFSLLMLVHSPLSARLIINYSECAFQESCTSDGDDAGVNSVYEAVSIGSLIVNGAGYFLKANSETLLFLSKYELSELDGVDYAELQEILKNAISNMESARDIYVNLNAAAMSVPYEEAFIQKLMDYDYKVLQHEKGFVDEIYREVRFYLSGGDVRGYYISFQLKLEDLLNKLYMIKTHIDAKTLPPVADVWALNREFSGTMMSGQYAAEIFSRIK